MLQNHSYLVKLYLLWLIFLNKQIGATMENNGYLTPQELAMILGKSNQAVYASLKNKNIVSIEISKRKRLIPPSSIKTLLEMRHFKYHKKIFSVHDLKGGVGKTTIALSFSVRASHYGFKVLMIDIDLQSNLTHYCNIDPTNLPVWINILRKDTKIEDCIINVSEYLDLIPSNLNNSRLEIELAGNSSINIKDNIKDTLEPIINKYDLIVIDCPPSLCKTTTMATCASDLTIIPINPDQFSIDGMHMTIDEISRIKKAYKLPLKYKILWNKYDARKKLAPFFIQQLAKDEEKYSNTLPVVIRIDSAFETSQSMRKSIFEAQRRSNAQEDIDALVRELLNIESVQTNNTEALL